MQEILNLKIEDFELTPDQYILSRKELYPFMFYPFGQLNYKQAFFRIEETKDSYQASRLEAAVQALRTCHAVSVLQAIHEGKVVPQRVLDCYKPPDKILKALQQSTVPECLRSIFLPCINNV